jgi:hypothetical protein
VVAVISVLFTTVTFVAGTAAKVTTDPAVKFVPVMLTGVATFAGPEPGPIQPSVTELR